MKLEKGSISITRQEMYKLPPLGKTIRCPTCGKRHRVKESWNLIREDDLRVEYYKCRGQTYLCGINGRKLEGI